jgi:hypothetical protein
MIRLQKIRARLLSTPTVIETSHSLPNFFGIEKLMSSILIAGPGGGSLEAREEEWHPSPSKFALNQKFETFFGLRLNPFSVHCLSCLKRVQVYRPSAQIGKCRK